MKEKWMKDSKKRDILPRGTRTSYSKQEGYNKPVKGYEPTKDEKERLQWLLDFVNIDDFNNLTHGDFVKLQEELFQYFLWKFYFNLQELEIEARYYERRKDYDLDADQMKKIQQECRKVIDQIEENLKVKRRPHSMIHLPSYEIKLQPHVFYRTSNLAYLKQNPDLLPGENTISLYYARVIETLLPFNLNVSSLFPSVNPYLP